MVERRSFAMKLSETDLAWLVGFIEGEGSFGVSICISKTDQGIKPTLLFKLALAERDKEVIYKLREMLGIGWITFKRKELWQKHGIKNASNQYSFLVTSVDECQTLCNLLDESLFKTAKKNDFLLWKEAVKNIGNFEHLKKDGLLRLAEIRDMINGPEKTTNYKAKAFFMNAIEKRPQLFTIQAIEKRTAKAIIVRESIKQKKSKISQYKPKFEIAPEDHVCIDCRKSLADRNVRAERCETCRRKHLNKLGYQWLKKHRAAVRYMAQDVLAGKKTDRWQKQ
ncbi:MAG: LAGLIDADG family homing endonuclease [Candidatus Diapherotrites archaeon]|uniref:LAGLIDADG family homing endonuclease n=1 Tax=Candidatus Iainarchaeum sp. TaxID=3101447 RepID=A0A8T4L2I2_9ARCH|nr:LAGLIDADG family homing endonuclease [Candidatus Diapherotrites archaeon]